MKKIWGKISYYYAKFAEIIYKGLILASEFIVDGADAIKKIFLPFIILGGIGIFSFPPLMIFMFTGIGLTLILMIIILFLVSYMGRIGVNSLKKIAYARLKFLYDYSRAFSTGGNYRSYKFYKEEYEENQRRKFEEELRKEEERRRQRQKAQEEQWRRFFEENFGGYGSYTTGGSNYGGYYNNTQNQFFGFKQKYEEACDVLGVPYNSDYKTIRSKYRQLAKKYHPDLSKERNAEEMFKKINSAFDVLSEENVERYRNL